MEKTEADLKLKLSLSLLPSMLHLILYGFAV